MAKAVKYLCPSSFLYSIADNDKGFGLSQ